MVTVDGDFDGLECDVNDSIFIVR